MMYLDPVCRATVPALAAYLLFAALPASGPSPFAAPADTIPFTLEEARIYVPVTTADGRTRSFILDTGAAPTMVDVRVAEELGLTLFGGERGRGAGRGSTLIRNARGLALRVGAVELNVSMARVAALDSLLRPHTGRRIDGIIGSQFFAEHVVEVDFEARELRVHSPASYVHHGKGTVVPVELWAGVPVAAGMLRLPDRRAISARMLIDLGAKANALISETYIAEQGLDTAIPGGATGTLGAGIGGETRYRFVRLPSVSLGAEAALAEEDVAVGLSIEGTLRGTGYDVLLGTGFLQHYRVVADHPRRRYILERRRGRTDPDEFDMSGVYLIAGFEQGPAVRVLRVEPGSPAELGGLRPGDEVVSVDGRNAGSQRLSAIRAALRGPPGGRVVLRYRRGERLGTATVTLRRRV